MAFRPVDVADFRGLDLRDPEDATGALECSNVVLSAAGRIAARPGYVKVGSATSGTGATGSHAYTAYDTFTNLVTNPDFETNTTGWSASGGTLSRVATSGGYALKLTATTKNQSVSSTTITGLTAGNSYRFYFNYVGATSDRTATFWAELAWASSSGTISTSNWSYSTVTGGAAGSPFGVKDVTAVAPTGADRVMINFYLTGNNVAAGYYFTVDQVMFLGASYTGDFLAGTTTSATSENIIIGYNGASNTDAVRLLKDDGTDATGGSPLIGLTSGSAWSFASLGGVSWGANGKTLVKATTSVLSQPTVTTIDSSGTTRTSVAAPKPLFLETQSPDNRLVAAGFLTSSSGPRGASGPTAYASSVFFSQAEDATTWDETDFVILGDSGEPITGLAAWGTYVLAFKDREWYVFYGNSRDATGGTVFNYRRIDPGCTMVAHQTGRDGIYVLDEDGNIWKTAGGTPVLVFRGGTQITPFSGQGFRAGRRVGLPAYYLGTKGYLVYDEGYGQAYFFSFADNLTSGTSVGKYAYFPYTTGLARYPDGTTDNTTAISSTYTLPYSSFGEPGAQKHVRGTDVHGAGTISLAWGQDLQAHGTAYSVTPSNGIGWDRHTARGRTLSLKLTGAAGGWSVNRLVPWISYVRTGR